MKKTIFISGLALSSLFFQACTDDFEDINTDPTKSTEVSDPSYLLVRLLDQGVMGNYQRNTNLYADLYSQYFANTVDGFVSPQYVYNDGWVGNFWKEFYTERLKESNEIKRQTAENNTTSNMYNMTEIYTVFLWSRMVDYYGDLPYFDLVAGETKAYDKTSDIYPDLLNRLKTATEALSNSSDQAKFSEGYDYLYSGDVEKWRRFGNSLRLRLALRLSNVDPSLSRQHAEDAVASGVFVSNDDVAKIPLWVSGWYDYLPVIAVDWGNIRVSKTFTNYINNQSSIVDPRAELWLTKYNDIYDGVVNGYTAPTASDPDWNAKTTIKKDAYPDFNQSAGTMAAPVMFYAEVLFSRAEMALRGWNAGGSYESLYEEGIRASMAYVGVSDNALIDSYISGLPTFNSLSSNEAKFKQIITQKWIANFPNGMEGWAEFRRTDYPDITLPADGVSGSATVAPSTYVKRISYPTNEHNTNSQNMPSNMNTPESDRMDIKIWWDVAGSETKSGGLINSNF